VIAEVHGIATAAGCQLVASCDLAVASEDARFATSGRQCRPVLLDADGGAVRAVGRKAAMEMLLTGDLIDAATAKSLGLVNQVVPAAELRGATDALARKIAAKSSSPSRSARRPSTARSKWT
jgi:enoyl-CoA hydratase/carnithine racemase